MIPLPLSADAIKWKYYVYLLRSEKDVKKKYYLGYTNDLLRRLSEHNEGLSEFTRDRRPYKLVYFETFDNSLKAKQREKILKRIPKMLYYLKKRSSLCSLAPKALKEVVG
jgi:putative endonuclease